MVFKQKTKQNKTKHLCFFFFGVIISLVFTLLGLKWHALFIIHVNDEQVLA